MRGQVCASVLVLVLGLGLRLVHVEGICCTLKIVGGRS